ncbi:hypothetical protein MRB53_039516 [Persea americana]|nr:hypothetical protein MRB53_039516 [Persea americana]
MEWVLTSLILLLQEGNVVTDVRLRRRQLCLLIASRVVGAIHAWRLRRVMRAWTIRSSALVFCDLERTIYEGVSEGDGHKAGAGTDLAFTEVKVLWILKKHSLVLHTCHYADVNCSPSKVCAAIQGRCCRPREDYARQTQLLDRFTKRFLCPKENSTRHRYDNDNQVVRPLNCNELIYVFRHNAR